MPAWLAAVEMVVLTEGLQLHFSKPCCVCVKPASGRGLFWPSEPQSLNWTTQYETLTVMYRKDSTSKILSDVDKVHKFPLGS